MGDTMSEELKKYLEKGTDVTFFLGDGKVVKGMVKELGDSYIIVENTGFLCGINIKSIIMWEISREVAGRVTENVVPVEEDTKKEDTILHISSHNTMENLSEMAALSKLIQEFNIDSPISVLYHLRDIETRFPSDIDFSEKQESKKKWDKVNNQYRAAQKSGNLAQLSFLAGELSDIARKHPTCGMFNCKAGIFLSMIDEYEKAAEEFKKAFIAETNADFIYNAAYSYLKVEDIQNAYICFGIYFNYVLPSADRDAWFIFCQLAERTGDLYIFSRVLEHYLLNTENIENKQIIDNWDLLIRSIVFVLYKQEDYKKATYLSSLQDMAHLEKEHVSQILESSFSDLNRTICKEYEDILEQVNSLQPHPEENRSGIIDEINPTRTNTISFMRGNIYAYKHGGFGFIRDHEGVERYFYFRDILDEDLQSKLNGVRWGNDIPVFFEPSKGKDGRATAIKIISQNLVDNIIKQTEAFEKEGDIVSALNSINEAVDFEPDNINILDIKDRLEKACNTEQSKGKQKFILNPKTPEEWYEKALIHLTLKQYDDALLAFEHSSEESPLFSSIWHIKGVAYFNSKRYDEALECFEKALDMNPFNHRTWFGKGCCLMRKADPKESLESFEKAIELRINYEEAWINKAIAYFLMERYNESIRTFDKALLLNPNNYSSWSWKATAHLKTDHFQEAYFSVGRALDIAPYDAESLFSKGYILSKDGKLEDALNFFEQSLNFDPYNIKALTKKAFVLSNLGRDDEALEDIEAAMELGPDNPKTWYYKGVILMNAGDYENAHDSLERSLAIKPGVERVARSLQVVLMKLGRKFDEELTFTSDEEEDSILEDFMEDSYVPEIEV